MAVRLIANELALATEAQKCFELVLLPSSFSGTSSGVRHQFPATLSAVCDQSWTTTTIFKETQSHFVAIVHSFLLLLWTGSRKRAGQTPLKSSAAKKTWNNRKTTEVTRATTGADLHPAPALHPGRVQTRPLPAHPLASICLTASRPAPATRPRCRSVPVHTRR